MGEGGGYFYVILLHLLNELEGFFLQNLQYDSFLQLDTKKYDPWKPLH